MVKYMSFHNSSFALRYKEKGTYLCKLSGKFLKFKTAIHKKNNNPKTDFWDITVVLKILRNQTTSQKTANSLSKFS